MAVLAQHAGANLFTQTPEIANWLATLMADKARCVPVNLGSIVFALLALCAVVVARSSYLVAAALLIDSLRRSL